MIDNLLLNNNLFGYGIIVGCGLTLGCSVYYLIRRNNVANLPNNTEAINNENMVPNSNIEDLFTDSDFETDIASDYASEYDNASTADFDEILKDPDLFFLPHFESKFKDVEFVMPDIDLNVCPIEELKLYEFCSLYGKEMAEHSITEEEMMELISLFPEKELATN
jgi:hypothetical protein